MNQHPHENERDDSTELKPDPSREPAPAEESPDTTGGGTGTPLLHRQPPSSGNEGAKKG